MSKIFKVYDEFYFTLLQILYERSEDLESINHNILRGIHACFNPVNNDFEVKNSLGDIKFSKMPINPNSLISFRGIHFPMYYSWNKGDKYRFAITVDSNLYPNGVHTLITVSLNSSEVWAEYGHDLTRLSKTEITK